MLNLKTVARRAGFGAVALGLGVSMLSASAASASTPAGAVTIADPSSNTALTVAQASTKLFEANLPGPVNCPVATTQPGGDHVFSFMVQSTGTNGADPATINFGAGSPSVGFGYLDNTGSYVGTLNTSTTGQANVNLPNNLQFSGLVSGGLATVADLTANGGVWHTGWACADGNTGAVALDASNNPVYWMQDVQFTASTGDPNGFTWTPVSGSTTVAEAPLAVVLPIGGAAVIGFGVVANRRRSRRRVVVSA